MPTILQTTMLFRNMTESEIAEALDWLESYQKTYEKGETIFHAGNLTKHLGLVLSGSVTVESNDMWGNRTILSLVETDEFFAETYALVLNEPLMVDVVANENCRILFLKIGKLTDGSAMTEVWQNKLIQNLLLISSHKNLALSSRSFHISPKTVRGRIMAYLNSVSLKKGNREFDIPFDRQQMADYLNLERTALSKELGRMKAEGIIMFRKNHFSILQSCVLQPDEFSQQQRTPSVANWNIQTHRP